MDKEDLIDALEQKWLVIYDFGKQEIVAADDLFDLHCRCGDGIVAVIQLNSDIVK